jgi:hypothetical protein
VPTQAAGRRRPASSIVDPGKGHKDHAHGDGRAVTNKRPSGSLFT